MKTKIIWLQGISCNGNIHSFLNYENMDMFFEDFELIYHPTIETDTSLRDLQTDDSDIDILLIDGAISKEYTRVDISIPTLIQKYAKKAKKIVAVGSCASYGGIFKYTDIETTQGLILKEQKDSNILDIDTSKVINISGCPIHPRVLVNTLYQIKKDIAIILDELHRPKEYYTTTIHNGCTRNEYFEWKVDSFDFGEKEGCMFYDRGCQAPYTRGSCNKILWNSTNSKTRSGSPCFGCNEPSFPTNNLFETKKNMSIPQNLPLGVPKRAYLTLAGIAKTFKIARLESKN
jgi:hydrogenase small subunit